MPRKKKRGCMTGCLTVDAETANAETTAPAEVTPIGGSSLDELFKAMDASIGWKLRDDKDENGNPNPIKYYLQTTFHSRDSPLKEAISREYPNLMLSEGTQLQEHDLSVKLFLFCLCAMLCGHREDYMVDPWHFVAERWSHGVLRT